MMREGPMTWVASALNSRSGDDAFQPGAAAGVCVCQVDFAVFIPNGAGIDNAPNLFYQHGLLHGPSARTTLP
ncbi:MAG: hypothetical protein ACLUHA_13345 [Bacteroides stercoris]